MKSRLYDTASLLVCSLLTAAAGKMAFKTFNIELSFGFAFLWSLVFVVALYLILINKKIALVILGAATITGLIVFLRLEEQSKEIIHSFINESFDFLKNGGELSVWHIKALGMIMLFAFSVVLILPSVIFPFFPALLAICITLVIMQWGQNNTLMLTETSIIFGALIVFFARSMKISEDDKTKIIRNISAAWLVPFASVIMLIVAGIAHNEKLDAKWKWLEVRTNIIGDYLSELSGNTVPRTIFDISKYGYQPLGGRLGGPVDLSDTEIMEVITRYQILLRGNIKNTYTGFSWLDDTVSYRSRLINKFKAEQEYVFNLDIPGETQKDNFYFDDIETYISPSINASATIFTPIRVTGIKPEKLLTMLISFNTEGEVFASRDIDAGISYTVESEHIRYESVGFDAYVLETQQELNAEYPIADGLFELNYMQEFEAVPKSVDSLAKEITEGIQNDYLKAMAIKSYLEDGFIYTLNPGTPPEETDFVVHFLETKEGYCTYFASAMAVMARSAGLPSRYVEGFKVPEGNPSRTRAVTGENAHAWAEIYIKGFGWLPFEPRTSDGTAAPTEAPEEIVEEEIFEEATPEPEITEETESEKNRSPLAYIIAAGIVVGLVLAAAILLFLSKLRANLKVVKSRYAVTNEAIIFYYKEIMAILSYLRYEKPVGHTLNTYAEGVDVKIVMSGCLFKNVVSAVSQILYAKRNLKSEYLTSVHAYYWSILKYIKSRLGFARYFMIMIKLLFTKSLRKNGKLF